MKPTSVKPGTVKSTRQPPDGASNLAASSLQGQRVMVVGASRGIGRAVALELGRRGAIVGVHYREGAESARAVVDDILAAEGNAAAFCFDVRDAEAVRRESDRFAAENGGLDALVCCAGVLRTGLLALAADVDLKAVLEVNVLGALHCARAALPHLLRQRGGNLVFIGSVAAHRPTRGQVAYAASKAALEGLTRALAVEYAQKGIRAHCVVPGAIETEMLAGARALDGERSLQVRVPLRRVGAPADVAGVVAFLLCSDASYMTGGIVAVDGGYSIA